MTHPLWTSEEASQATGGTAAGDWQVHSVSIDSRTIEPGGLFVAIVGERVDGHDYVQQALEAGAAAAMVSQPVEGVPQEKLLIVDDTLKALEALGKRARARTNAKIIGVTGSVGKTTTKECLRLMCESFGKTHASKGNLNNHYGAPLSLANMAADTEFGVFEMGMNHAGEIAKLAKLAKPHVAIITTVEAVHLEFFKDERGIADAKAEIFEGLEPGGTAILNADNEHTEYIISSFLDLSSFTCDSKNSPPRLRGGEGAKLTNGGGTAADTDGGAMSPLPKATLSPSPPQAGGISPILTFGKKSGANVHFMTSGHTKDGVTISIEAGDKPLELSLTSGGVAIESAVMIGLATAMALSLDLDQAAKSLEGFTEVKGRGQLMEVTVDGKQMWWMDDSYNASPASMRAAFEKLAMVKKQKQARRSVAVLGDMLELGEQEKELHAELAKEIANQKLDAVYTVGPLMLYLHEALPSSIKADHARNLREMQQLLKDQLHAVDVVLFKGSNGSKIHQLVKAMNTSPACGGGNET